MSNKPIDTRLARLSTIRDITTPKIAEVEATDNKTTRKTILTKSQEKKTIRISLPLTILQRLDCLRLTPNYQSSSRSQLLSLLLEKALEEQSIQDALNSLSKSIK